MEPIYPALEGFIEIATPEEVRGLFKDLHEALEVLKGPKAPQAGKIRDGLGEAEELLEHLLRVRERLEKDRKSAKGKK